ANGVRVFGMCANIARFLPQDYPQYFDRLGPFLDYLRNGGLTCEFVVFADAQMVIADNAAQKAHLARILAVTSTRPSVTIELVNEFPKNGVDPSQFAHPSKGVFSRGSGLGDDAPALPT